MGQYIHSCTSMDADVLVVSWRGQSVHTLADQSAVYFPTGHIVHDEGDAQMVSRLEE